MSVYVYIIQVSKQSIMKTWNDTYRYKLFILIFMISLSYIIIFNLPNNFHWILLEPLLSSHCKENDGFKNSKMGQFEYEQWHHLYEHPSHEMGCLRLYNITMHKDRIVQLGIIKEYTKYVKNYLKYNIEISPVKHTDKNLILTVAEMVRGKASLGGSSFRAELRGSENALCTSKDYFNGTYMVVCPILDSCVDIVMQLKYINFDAYLTPKLVALNKLILNTSWCPLVRRQQESRYLCCQSRTRTGDSDGRWRYSDISSWQWFEKGCSVDYVPRYELVSCLQAINSIHIVGDSHIRYLTEYLMHMWRGTPPERVHKWENFNTSNMYFWWSTVPARIAKDLNTLRWSSFRNESISKKDIVLISTGAWDMNHAGLKYSITQFDQTLVPQLKQFLQDPYWSKATILFMNTVPYPSHRSMVIGAGYRTNFGLAALNYWMDMRMRQLAIPVIDSYSIIQFRNDESVCGNHYACYKQRPRDNRTEIHGTVGYKVSDVILRYICRL